MTQGPRPKLPRLPWSPARIIIIIVAIIIGISMLPLVTPSIFNHRWIVEVMIYTYLTSFLSLALIWMQMERMVSEPTRLTLDFARSLTAWLMISMVILVGSFGKAQYPQSGEYLEQVGMALGVGGLICNIALAFAMLARIKRAIREKTTR